MTSDEELLSYKYHILKNTTDGEEGFNLYLDSLHINVITEDFMCLYTIENEYIALYYLEAFNRRGYVNSAKFIRELFIRYTLQDKKPIIYTGLRNIGKNNSIEIEPNVYQLVLKSYDIK